MRSLKQKIDSFNKSRSLQNKNLQIMFFSVKMAIWKTSTCVYVNEVFIEISRRVFLIHTQYILVHAHTYLLLLWILLHDVCYWVTFCPCTQSTAGIAMNSISESTGIPTVCSLVILSSTTHGGLFKWTLFG